MLAAGRGPASSAIPQRGRAHGAPAPTLLRGQPLLLARDRQCSLQLQRLACRLAANQGASSVPPAGDNGPSTSEEASSAVPLSGRASFRSVLTPAYLGEMLFVVIGSLMAAGLAQWTLGTSLRRFNPYSFHVMLPLATGVVRGTPLRMKGVPMGSVVATTPMLDRVDVEVEVNEAKTIIPRTATFELTQSGLIPAASIDISPPEGVSAEFLTSVLAARAAADAAAAAASSSSSGGSEKDSAKAASRAAKRAAAKARLANPKDVDACRLQGVLVCNGDRLDGLQGGSMDELMAHMLKSLRRGETEGNGNVPGRGPIQG